MYKYTEKSIYICVPTNHHILTMTVRFNGFSYVNSTFFYQLNRKSFYMFVVFQINHLTNIHLPFYPTNFEIYFWVANLYN